MDFNVLSKITDGVLGQDNGPLVGDDYPIGSCGKCEVSRTSPMGPVERGVTNVGNAAVDGVVFGADAAWNFVDHWKYLLTGKLWK